LRITPLAGHRDFSRLTIASIDDRNTKARRLWVNSCKQAEKVIGETFSSDRRCRRGGDGGLIVEAAAVEVEGLIRASARLIGVTLKDDSWIDAALSTIALRIDAMIRQMKKTGRLKAVNAAYDALPATDRPPYNSFLTCQLRAAIRINPADVPLLLSTLRAA
jgi:hypothetical protein